MDRENTKRKPKKSSKQRQKQRIIILIALVSILLILITVVVAKHMYEKWEARFDSTTSVIFIQEDGTVVTNDVVRFDTAKYSQSELEKFIKETIDTYNYEKGDGKVKQEELTVENNSASLILTFADVDTYMDFTGEELFVGSIAEAVTKGFKFDGQFAAVVNKRAVESSIDKFYGQTDLKVAIIKANTKVSIEGEILYMSADNVAEFGENWVVTKEGANILAPGTQPTETESTSGNVPETETDTDVSDGSVDETELVPEETETSTDIVFDFGDEAETDEIVEDTYSESYTYIIYK